MARSIFASLRVARGLVEICAETLAASRAHGYRHDETNARIARWALGVVRDERMALSVEGRSHFLPGEAFVIMSNHQSHLDIPVLFHTLSPSIRMVTKKELFGFPIFGPAMRVAGFVEVDRGNRSAAIESLKSGAAVMKEGIHIWIAPEGTRSRTGELAPFKKGGFMLARETGARILPVGLWGTRDVLAPGSLASATGRRVAVVVGAPIATEGKERDALMAETREAISALVERARAAAAG